MLIEFVVNEVPEKDEEEIYVAYGGQKVLRLEINGNKILEDIPFKDGKITLS